MASASDKSKLDERISKLKEMREKKEKGLDYNIEDIHFTKREQRVKQERSNETKGADSLEGNPYIRRITLDELMNISRVMKGEKIAAPERKTPFIRKEKEIKTPEMNKQGM